MLQECKFAFGIAIKKVSFFNKMPNAKYKKFLSATNPSELQFRKGSEFNFKTISD